VPQLEPHTQIPSPERLLNDWDENRLSLKAMPESSSVFITEALRTFRGYKKRTEAAFAQLSPNDWFRLIDPEANSIAIIVKHMAGNMRSRWTDFLTSDGEKPDRDRDREFVLDSSTTPGQVIGWWEQGWKLVFDAVEPLTEADLSRTITIRGQDHTVLEAISRQLTHYAEHVGQIILLAKHFRGTEWKSLSIPKGQSAVLAMAAELTNKDRRGA
jgi:hypothetical protein